MQKKSTFKFIISNRKILSWCLYDVGNSAFATTILAAILPVYFKEVAAAPLNPALATAFWGYASSIAMLISAFAAPLLGTIADIRGSKKGLLAFFTALAILATGAMSMISYGDWKITLVLLIISSVGFSGGIIFYDSLLPHIAPLDKIDMVSAQGFALGYLGGGLMLGINMVMIVTMPGTMGARAAFLSVALWWALFTIPVLKNIPEPPIYRENRIKGTNVIKASAIRLKETFREVRKYSELFKFLFAFWLYNDGIGTIIRMAAIYGAQLGFAMTDLVGALLLTQFVGVPFTLFFGWLAGKIGSKKSLFIALLFYMIISVGAVFLSVPWHFWTLAVAVGMVQGGAQAISRSLYASMVPAIQSAEFFSFYDISSKFSGLFGPALFGLITQLTGSSRFGIAVVSLTFVFGMAVLAKVDIKKGRRMAAIGTDLL